MDSQPTPTSKRDHLPGKLEPRGLRTLRDGWHCDGGNLYLFVRGNARSWVFRYTSLNNKKLRRSMGLGSLEAVSLARAREVTRECRAKLRDPLNPVDPIDAAKAEKDKRQAAAGQRMTFKECAEAYIEVKRSEWANKKHAKQWENTLKTHVYPFFGNLPVSQVDTPLVTKCLLEIWNTKTETATRLRNRIEKVLDWAKVSGFRNGENPARWRGHLKEVLPTPSKIAPVVHFAALPYEEIGGFMATLRTKQGMGAKALEFTILTAARSGETRGATWGEIDFNKAKWTLPAERMKTNVEHEVPLSTAALALLRELPRTDDQHVFPGSKLGVQLSDVTLSKVIRRMGDSTSTVHGMRSTFRDWVAEQTGYGRELGEKALAHAVGDASEQAYKRGQMFEKRRLMMEEWATYCDAIQPTGGAADVQSLSQWRGKKNVAS